MAIIDSIAAFADRCQKFGLDDPMIDMLKQNRLCSYGAFANVARFNPAATDDQPLSDSIEAISGTKPTALQMVHLRRLHFESYALTVAETKLRLDGVHEDTSIRKLPAPERTARYTQQKNRLTGLVWSLSLEPSHHLCDKVQQQVEENLPAYISLDHCTSRQQELAGVKKEQTVRIDITTGTMRIAEQEADQSANTSTDHHLRLAFRRRALAYDQCNIASYEVMETWTEKLFSAMLDSAPPGYSAPSRDRILAADRQLFSKIVESCRDGVILRSVNGVMVKPVEAAITNFANDSAIIFHLLPLPTIHASSHSAAMSRHPDGETETNSQRRKRKKAAQTERQAPTTHAKPQARAAATTGGRGKGKGKGKGKEGPLPPSLKGCHRIVKGEKACIFFNMAICENTASPGESCRQGIHLCMTPGCGDLHPAVSCPMRTGKQVQ